MRKIE